MLKQTIKHFGIRYKILACFIILLIVVIVVEKHHDKNKAKTNELTIENKITNATLLSPI